MSMKQWDNFDFENLGPYASPQLLSDAEDLFLDMINDVEELHRVSPNQESHDSIVTHAKLMLKMIQVWREGQRVFQEIHKNIK